MENDYIAGLLGRGDLSSGFAYFAPVVQEGTGTVFQGEVGATGVGTGQASLTLAGVIVVLLMIVYATTRGRQH
jgi:hypothetical protein